ncbi:MAG: hypothetical protein Q9227_009131 [Pyrenula ochraceoflavens]
MLNDPDDPYNASIFQLIFNTTPRTDSGQAVTDRLQDIFQALVLMQHVNHELRGNFRYHCDNDRLGGSSRWQLKRDPENPPSNYIPQAQRPMFPDTINGQYQEWVDRDNQIQMGPNRGCQDPGVLAQTYDAGPVWVQYPGYPQAMIEATTTICDLAFDVLHPTVVFITHTHALVEMNIDRFTMTTSFVILHQFTNFPPWRLDNIELPRDNERRGAPWQNVIAIGDTFRSLQNADSLAYFALIARLKDLNYFFGENQEWTREGRMFWQSSHMIG